LVLGAKPNWALMIKIIAKGFANRTRFKRTNKPRDLGVVHRMAVFMHDHFTIFGIVHPALAQANCVLRSIHRSNHVNACITP